MTKITKISTNGIGAYDREITLPPVAVVIGRNEAGKSTLVGGLQVAAEGYYTAAAGIKVSEKPSGAMLLARDRRKMIASIEGESGGEEFFVRRTFTRDQKGDIATKLDTPWSKGQGKTESQAQVRARLATRPEVWDPTLFLRITSGELRKMLLRALGARVRLEDVVPHDIPLWGRAEVGDDPHVWLARAKKALAEEISVATRAKKTAEDNAIEFESWWTAVEDPAPLEAKISRLEEILRGPERLEELAGAIATAEAEVSRLEGVLDEAGREISLGMAAREKLVDLRQALQRAVTRGAHKQALPGLERDRARILEEKERLEDVAEGPTAQDTDAVALSVRGMEEARAARRRMLERVTFLERRRDEDSAALAALVPPRKCSLCNGVVPAEAAQFREEEETLQARVAEHARRIEELGPLPAAPSDEEYRLAQESMSETLQRRKEAEKARTALVAHGKRLEEVERALADAKGWLEEYGPEGPAVESLEADAAALEGTVSKAGAAEERARVAKKVHAQARVKVRVLSAEIDEIPALAEGEEALTRASLEATRTALSPMEEANKNRREYASRLAIQEAAAIALVVLQEWRSRLEEIERDIVEASTGPLLAKMSEIAGGRVDLQLVAPSGAPDCSFLLNEVPLEVISDGRRLRFVAAFTGALLALDPEVRWSPLIIDRIEGVSIDQRPALVAMARDLVDRGIFDQAFLLGCPDLDTGLPEDTIHL